MRTRVVAALTLATVALLAGCAAGPGTAGSGTGTAGSGASAAELVSDRCTRCHPVDRIKAANHDAAGWSATVTRMRGKGARLSDAEAAKVVTFLASGGAGGL